MNETKSSQKQNISGLMVLLLFGIFAVCILSVLFSGTRIYDRLTERDKITFDTRSAVQYLATRIHQAENAASLTLESAEGGTMLRIAQAYGEELYETLLYCHDGWLCELFVPAGEEFEPDAGERILPVERMTGTIDNGLLTLSVADENGEQTISLLLRGGEVHP